MIKLTKPVPGLGIAAIILHNNKILLGRRLKNPMLDCWQLPGGWLHYGESPGQAVTRKIHEFPGMQCDTAEFVTFSSNLFEDGLHSISAYFQMNCLNLGKFNLAQNKHCSDWFWADWYDLPQPLFLPLQLLKESGFEPGKGK